MTEKEIKEEAENCTCYAANGKCSKDVYDIIVEVNKKVLI